jgi:cytochrome b subunit of formate dehydrogenase
MPRVVRVLCCVVWVCLLASARAEAAEADCLGCHDDPSLKTKSGRPVGVKGQTLKASVHASLKCTDCHDQAGKYDDAPHFTTYHRVQCKRCHADAAATFAEGFHGLAGARGVAKVPGCLSCHRVGRDNHRIERVASRATETACRDCHQKETKAFATSVHAKATASKDRKRPSCTGCHPTHSRAYPPSMGAIDKRCIACHQEATKDPAMSLHGKGATQIGCASCHDVHATQKPDKDAAALKACVKCHPKVPEQFKDSVHAQVFEGDQIDCLACHQVHQLRTKTEPKELGCGSCHADAERDYRRSAHRVARLKGNKVAALCSDCHGGHRVIGSKDPRSPVNHRRIPETCGKCHTGKGVITEDYVRLPITLARYDQSVHGQGQKVGKPTAGCTDCHGWHDMEVASSPTSSISRQNLARTCGQCHTKEASEYADSVHGRAVAHGIKDSPTCTSCHDEHLILRHSDSRSPVNPANLSSRGCAQCHRNPEMAAKYGLPPDVVRSYDDSYHGWALKRGGRAAAVCFDCHGVHAIGSPLDPKSATHKNNVVATCGRCHANANPTFAASYSHLAARGKRMPHDIARIIYLWLLALVLGGMFLHNLLLYLHDLRTHYRATRREAAVRRMSVFDVWLHVALLLTFLTLALTGFALRFPDAWWSELLTKIGLSEEVRKTLHRAMAIGLVVTSVAHLVQVAATRRGRLFIRAMFPRLRDLGDAAGTMGHALGRSTKEPRYDAFDYTQKAEYWALIWGTIVMSLTGFVLWFPTMATRWVPAWAVRVCETIHFYEAILAITAILIWHLFFVVFKRGTYPMSWTWITGRMPLTEWEHHHGRAAADARSAELAPPADDPPPAPDPEA